MQVRLFNIYPFRCDFPAHCVSVPPNRRRVLREEVRGRVRAIKCTFRCVHRGEQGQKEVAGLFATKLVDLDKWKQNAVLVKG